MKTTTMMVTGEYSLRFYNRYGARLRDLDTSRRCLTEAIAAGTVVIEEAVVKEDLYQPTSFTVDRRIYNSLDTSPVG